MVSVVHSPISVALSIPAVGAECLILCCFLSTVCLSCLSAKSVISETDRKVAGEVQLHVDTTRNVLCYEGKRSQENEKAPQAT